MDIITYIPDLDAFRLEGGQCMDDNDHPCESLFSYTEEEGLTFNTTKIPVKYKSGESVCLVRTNQDFTQHLSTIERLGECIDGEYVFDSDEARSKYESVYDTTTRLVDDGVGGQVEYTPPYMIGVFA